MVVTVDQVRDYLGKQYTSAMIHDDVVEIHKKIATSRVQSKAASSATVVDIELGITMLAGYYVYTAWQTETHRRGGVLPGHSELHKQRLFDNFIDFFRNVLEDSSVPGAPDIIAAFSGPSEGHYRPSYHGQGETTQTF